MNQSINQPMVTPAQDCLQPRTWWSLGAGQGGQSGIKEQKSKTRNIIICLQKCNVYWTNKMKYITHNKL